MKINDIVFQDYQNIRRFGVITKTKKKENNWLYVKVKWFNDERYESAMNCLTELRGGKHHLNEYRIDQLKVIDAAHQIDTLNKCINFVSEQ